MGIRRGCWRHIAWVGTCADCVRHQAFGDWLGSFGWQVFGTSTVHRARVDASGVPVFPSVMTTESYSRRLASVIREAERRLGRRMVAVWGVEAHVSGYPHGHLLLGVQGGIREGDFRVIAGVHWERLGFLRLEYPRMRSACARYAAKYLLKAGGVLEMYPDVGSGSGSRGGLESDVAARVRRWERSPVVVRDLWTSILGVGDAARV